MTETCYYNWDVFLTAFSILATVALSIIAVWQNKRYKNLADKKDEIREIELKEENRLKIRPYLFTDFLEHDYTYLKDKVIHEFLYFNALPSEKKAIEIHSILPSEIRDEFYGENTTTQVFKALKNINKYMVVVYNIKNVGCASAVNVLLHINNATTYPPFALMVGETREIIFLFDFDEIGQCDKYEVVLDFQFSDIEDKTTYTQCTSFFIHEDESVENRKGHHTSSYCKTSEPKQIN